MEEIRSKIRLVEALLEQVEGLQGDILTAQVKYQFASSRPQVVEPIRAQTAQFKGEYDSLKQQAEMFEKVIGDITGIGDIEELRSAHEELITVFNAVRELEQEMRNRTLVTPTLVETMGRYPEFNTEEQRERAQQKLDELPELTENWLALRSIMMEIADGIKMNKPSNLITG